MTLWPDVASLSTLTDHQREQLARATAGPVGILGGSPGTGKTFTAAALLSAALKTLRPWDIAVCAPTGKAAVRLTESLLRNGVNDLEARTIHRTLGVSRSGYDGKGWGFQFNERNQLPYRLLIVDECSMIDTDLCRHLLIACEPGTHILMLGDIGQLPPVGHGAPLRDLIAAGVPYGELSEIKRNAGDIVRVCHAIRAGRRWEPATVADASAGSNLLVKHATSAAQSLGILRNMLTRAAGAGIDPVWDCQVLCTVNEKSDLGRKALNRMLQDLLNPAPPEAPQSNNGNGEKKSAPAAPFRLGDKVICTSNTLLDRADCGEVDSKEFAFDVENSKSPREFVANGELGQVVSISDRECNVKLMAPERTVVVPFVGKKSEARGDNEHAGAACDFDLGYAITVHKSQGSSARVILFLVDDYPGARMVSSRELVYTALSRAEELCVVIGQRRILEQDCRKVAITRRKTFLKELIKEELNSATVAN